MKIGMIIYSNTGNTLSVAEKIKKKLEEAGNEINLERVEFEGDVRTISSITDAKLTNTPDAGKYDTIIFGASVQAFGLSPVMKAYMGTVKLLKDKKVAILITEAFPYPMLGGNQAVKWMTRDCVSKGATILGSGIVNWMRKSREQQIDEVVEKICNLF